MLRNFISKNNKFMATLSSVFVGFFIAAIVLMIFGVDPFHLLTSLFKGAFADKIAIYKTMQIWTLYIFLGLSVMLGFKIGIFNIGVAGQMTFGMIISYLFVFNVDLSPGLLIFLSFIITLISAALFALVAAFLKTIFGVHEVVTTIMLNWIAVKVLNIAVRRNKIPVDNSITGGGIAALPNGVDANINSVSIYFTWMFFVAIIAVVTLFFVFKYTKLGRKILVSGNNPNAAKYSGYNEKTLIILTFAFSGLIAGLAGFTYFFSLKSISGSLIPIGDIQSPLNIGFLGIAISLVGMNSTIGVFLSALFFTLLKNPVGVDQVTTDMGVTTEVVDMFSSVIIYFVAVSNLFLEFVTIKNIKKTWKDYVLQMKNPKRSIWNKMLLTMNIITFRIFEFISKPLIERWNSKEAKNV